MGELLNEDTKDVNITEYDRSHSGSYENPYSGRPCLTFQMQRVMVRNSDDTVISSKTLESVQEPYTPNKTYQFYNPSTGEAIPGLTFTSDQLYAMIYSTMIRAISDAAARKAATIALSIAQTNHQLAHNAHTALVEANAPQEEIDAAAGLVASTEAAVVAAQAVLDALL
jgi:hypothetical protein